MKTVSMAIATDAKYLYSDGTTDNWRLSGGRGKAEILYISKYPALYIASSFRE